jgi:uncharacterized protein YjbI with pentapeptide repeats
MLDENTTPDLTREQAIDLLRSDVARWNQLREQYPNWTPDLRWAFLEGSALVEANLERATLFDAKLAGADLSAANLNWAQLGSAHLWQATLSKASLFQADLSKALVNQANLKEVDMREAHLWHTNLTESDLSGATLTSSRFIDAELNRAKLARADLRWANMSGAKLAGAQLDEAQLSEANLNSAGLRGSVLRGADLTLASMVNVDLEGADLTGCRVYGVNVWDAKVDNTTIQQNLVISRPEDQLITVDDLEVAQFINLLLHHDKIRNVIDAIGEKGVLILGRFTAERKAVLDAIRQRLRTLGFVPMMFDFERPKQRDFTETIKTLAGMSRFIIADITNPKSSPLELQAIMPDYMIPFVPIIHEDEEPFAMFQDLRQKYGEWVLDVLKYDSADNLLQVLETAVVRPALVMSQKLLDKKAEAIRERHVKDYM